MLALGIGTVLALAAVAFVLYPLLVAGRPQARQADVPEETPGSTAVEALREIEFDRQTGKLSDADYASLKASYTERALAELRTEPAAVPDPVETLVLGFRAQQRTCAEHGARPESDAAYCSECGRYLAGACPACGAAITEPAARFCAGCGNALAA
ncbi:MAG TPA: zinc ribbon domain-containing protein [Gemmatimonadaceae bacterium]|nr:zinc ribbon domain-containing protein [Gemmatimonadaceae bacterium]